MYVGHFVTALALKASTPKAPTWGLLIGVGFLDFLFSIFVAFGLEKISRAGFDFIDWSHSLLMALIWSVIFATLFWKSDFKVKMVLGISVFSHYLLDVLVHAPDMSLYPYSSVHLGLGLSKIFWGWWLELVILLVLGTYYVFRSSKSDAYGKYAILSIIFLLGLHSLRLYLGM